MYKKFLALTMMLSMAFGFEAHAMQNPQSMEYNKRILWAVGSAIGMGVISKAVRSPVGNFFAAHANYTTDEVDFVTSVSGVLSVMRIVDDSPMTRRWTAGLWITMIGYKLWSSYWMQDLLNLGAGALGQSIFPQKDIEYTKQQYTQFKDYSYELKNSEKTEIADYDKKSAFVEDYSYRKRSGLATAVMTVATVTPLLELGYYGCQKYLNVNMGL